MANEEQAQTQQQQQQQSQTQEQAQAAKTQKPDSGGGARYCKYCSKHPLLSANQRFCPNCGEEYGAKERTCPICATITTKAVCPGCGKSYRCSKCGAEGTSPICACGHTIDSTFAAVTAPLSQAAAAQEHRQMTKEEVQKLEARFQQEDENPDFKKIQKRLLEREKLLMERNYYEGMQKRILDVFGARPFKVELPDPEEQAALMRLYSSLERTIIDKQRRATQSELEAIYPELRHVHNAENAAADEEARAEEAERERRAEQDRHRRAMEDKYRALLENINKDIQDAKDSSHQADEAQKEAELKRMLIQKAEEEAALQREREAAEQRARDEAARRAQIAAEAKAAAEKRAKEELEARARREAEEIARASAARVDKEEGDRRLAEEAQRRAAEMQAAREQAARQAQADRILGTYYFQDGPEQLTILLEDPEVAICRDKFQKMQPSVYSEHNVKISGSNLKLTERANPSNYPMAMEFTGTFNRERTIITGYWIHRDGTQTKQYTYMKVK